jgi:glycosyltransferase involved in cell wall biosynthesis
MPSEVERMNEIVTIGIPTFERLDYLREAVASALAQTYSPIDVLISDDGDSDAIRGWCEDLVRKDSRVRYQKNIRNLGLAGNWNAVADGARGEYLIVIGDDDRLLPEFVRKCVDAILPDGAVAFSNQIIIDQTGNRIDEKTRNYPKIYGRDNLQPGWLSDAEACVWRNSVPISAALMRTADVKRLRFKEDINNPEIELFARLAAEGTGFAFVPEFLAEYRVHAQSATSGGLKSDRLAEYLMEIQVRPEVEKYKAALLAKMMVNAVSRCLVAGDRERARRLFLSNYYPSHERKRFRGLVQHLSIALPSSLGCSFYKTVWKLKSSCSCPSSGN